MIEEKGQLLKDCSECCRRVKNSNQGKTTQGHSRELRRAPREKKIEELNQKEGKKRLAPALN